MAEKKTNRTVILLNNQKEFSKIPSIWELLWDLLLSLQKVIPSNECNIRR